MHEFKAEGKDLKKRLDIFLVESLKDDYSRNAIKHAIEDGFVLVNGKKTKASHKLQLGEEIKFTSPPPRVVKITSENIPIEIIYEDNSIVVVNKPAGMVVHPAYGNYSKTLVNALMFHCGGRLAGLGGPLRPGIVHRLDKDVSGVIVAAKTDSAYRGLIGQFKNRTISREYIAFVKGAPSLKSGRVMLPIGRSRRDRKKMAVSLSGPGSKNAVTYYKVIKQFKDFAKLLITLGTGRTHQIRVHMSYMGHPILGDSCYGGPRELSDGRRIERVMLHAASIKLTHPNSGRQLHFESPAPKEFDDLLFF